MARLEVNYGNFERIEATLNGIGREGIRRILEAGAAAAVDDMRKAIIDARHVRTGDMRDSVRAGEYHETLGGGSISVYPQDEDRHGVANAKKAFVINYGRGKKKAGSKMGDKFITGRLSETEQVVRAAMEAEAERLMSESNG